MHHVNCPPLAPLRDVIARLERAGIVVALGGSGLLAALGLATDVRDWDLTTDVAPQPVAAALAGLVLETAGPGGVHADHKVMAPALATEVICGFAFHVKDGVVRIPTHVSGRWRGVPLASPEAWAVAYALLDRPEKAERLFGWLAGRRGDPTITARLLAQPLPEAVAARLAAVTSRNA